ncbi:hypothetical protein L1857_16870 [Amycolatopsis thermalba]|uniref:Uncharacterized protein n=1 Tax=Amycolatopsis thermalba TaxID=944492 RepID=A0ABY4NWG5_9PSEU|nr:MULTISPECIES: hypothetical protein [Amycolatopsis]UQS24378.1 hypothetical protein L1857_16870 [Amycolatopsis thermalba]
MMISEELRDTDVVAELQLWFPARDLATAVEACQGLIAGLGAWRFSIGPGNTDPPGPYDARLVIRSRSREGESAIQAIRRVALGHLEVIGLDPALLEIVELRGRPFGRVFRAELPDGTVVTMIVERGRDPFGTEPEEIEIEELEPLGPEGGFDEDEIRELMDLVHAATSTRIVIVAEISGADGIDAREMVRELAGDLRRQTFPSEEDIEVSEPRRRPSGTIEVAALVGGTEREAFEAVEAAARALRTFTWLEPAPVDDPRREDYFAVEAVPQEQFVRLEVHAATGLGVFG